VVASREDERLVPYLRLFLAFFAFFAVFFAAFFALFFAPFFAAMLFFPFSADLATSVIFRFDGVFFFAFVAPFAFGPTPGRADAAGA